MRSGGSHDRSPHSRWAGGHARGRGRMGRRDRRRAHRRRRRRGHAAGGERAGDRRDRQAGHSRRHRPPRAHGLADPRARRRCDAERGAGHGGILAINAEDDDLVMYMCERLEREGRTDIAHMPLVHSIMSEDISFRRVLRLARYVEGAAVYLVHVSSKAGTDAVAEARADGLPVYGETLHHYATFTAEAYLRPDG